MRLLWLGILVLVLILPSSVLAGGYAPSADELLQKIEELSRELNNVRQQLQEVQSRQEDQVEAVEDVTDKVEEMTTDGISRFSAWGDYRFRLDYNRARHTKYWKSSTVLAAMRDFTGGDVKQLPALMRKMQMAPPNMASAMLQQAGYFPESKGSQYNDTAYTNRLRLNVKVRPSENLVFKGRIAWYKLWGNVSDYTNTGNGIFPNNYFNNNMTQGVRPNDGALYVDRAYVNWTNIGGLPMWFSVGRRPTTHSVPQQFREGLDKRDATPFGANIDLPFDGATIGYQYELFENTGRIRFCYGRGFESGFKGDGAPKPKIDDTDFYGIAWDVIDNPDDDLLVIFQAFRAENLFDFPEGQMYLANPEVPFGVYPAFTTATTNLGNIWELGGVVQKKLFDVDCFASVGMSITDPKRTSQGVIPGLGQAPWDDPFEGVGLLTDPGEKVSAKTGWSVYVGGRIPVEFLNSKFGIEYNYGSEYWLPFLIATDDLYMNKLSTRGHVAEAYWVWTLPETPISRYANAFMRFGYQHYWFDYTGSGNWLGHPRDVDDLNNPMYAQAFTPVSDMDNFYLTFEVFF